MANEQLTESQEYADAIFATIREAVVVVNKDMRIKLANASFYKIFHSIAEKNGGQIVYEFGNGQWNNPKIKDLFNQILHHGSQFEGYEIQYEVPEAGSRIMLLMEEGSYRKRISKS